MAVGAAICGAGSGFASIFGSIFCGSTDICGASCAALSAGVALVSGTMDGASLIVSVGSIFGASSLDMAAVPMGKFIHW
jgi:hypothetical protein